MKIHFAFRHIALICFAYMALSFNRWKRSRKDHHQTIIKYNSWLKHKQNEQTKKRNRITNDRLNTRKNSAKSPDKIVFKIYYQNVYLTYHIICRTTRQYINEKINGCASKIGQTSATQYIYRGLKRKMSKENSKRNKKETDERKKKTYTETLRLNYCIPKLSMR